MKLRLACFTALTLLACNPVEPCACQPSTSMFLLYGTVVGSDELPVAGALVAARVSRNASCGEVDVTLESESARTDQTGDFRSHLRSFFAPGPRCLQVVAYRTQQGTSDSTVVLPFIVNFRMDREQPDSLGLIITLP
jgi:hypothetical protein